MQKQKANYATQKKKIIIKANCEKLQYAISHNYF